MRKNERIPLIVISACAAILLFVGWRLFWFLCDDAYISFRYVSNSLLGHGYVWNPPPFQPVEGYTNFLWLVLLDGVWRILGIEPPEAANALTLLFSALSLALVGTACWRMEWRNGLRRFRPLFLALVLLGVLSNRTFLAWSSSGLETAMFNCFLIAWLTGAVLIPPGSRRWGATLFLTAALAALTRPDGLLLVMVSIPLWGLVQLRLRPFRPTRLLEMIPLIMVVAHVIWRQAFYGLWLPNTYYAKFTGWWPESGLRYALSFVMEYALWLWIVVALVILFRTRRQPTETSGAMRFHRVILSAGVTTLAIHMGYYILVIGGDHFEYRVLSYAVPLLPLSLLWLLNRVPMRLAAAAGIFGLWILLSWPVPWTHWTASQRLVSRDETLTMRVSVAERWPEAFRWYAKAFDSLQFWLIEHYVCMRHQEHKVASAGWFERMLPTREEGLQLPAEGFPIMVASGGIGGLGWLLPRINLIDQYGLNDYVVARTPVRSGEERLMAHDRQAPPGYCESFRPNVFLAKPKQIIVTRRKNPMTAEEIQRVEAEWRERISTRADR